MEKRKRIGGTRGQVAVLHRVVSVGLTETLWFEQRLGGGESIRHMPSGARAIPVERTTRAGL